MWQGVFPAVTTKFDEDGELDHQEMARCFNLQIAAGCDGLIVCGSLGEGSMLSQSERLEVLNIAQASAAHRPTLMTVCEAGTRDACHMAENAARSGASGLMVVPSPIYHTDARETVANLRAIAGAADLPVMIYSNRVAYRVDITPDILEELADDARFVAVKESSDDIRRTTEIINRLGDRYAVFTGVDNLALEALVMGGRTGRSLPKRDGRHLPVGPGRAHCRSPSDLSLVPAPARSRCVDLSRAKYQARRSLGDRIQ